MNDSNRGNESIREHLKWWQAQQEPKDSFGTVNDTYSFSKANDVQNTFTQSGEDDSSTVMIQGDEAANEDDEEFEPIDSTLDILSPQVFFRRGDMVELW